MSTAPVRLRQIALVVKDIEKAEHLLTSILGTEVIFVDPQVAKWGIKNFLVAIGGDVIEVCSPFEKGTTAGRLLDKRGDGGYMIIMQTMDAAARRKYIESKGLAKVIYGYEHDDVVCVQYHPKGIPGGMMPELDSHSPTPDNPTPLASPYSPWHAAGKDHASYSKGMQRCSHLKLLEARCRLADGDSNIEAATGKWQSLFGVAGQNGSLKFTNATLRFVPGSQGKPDGLEAIAIQVQHVKKYEQTVQAAKQAGVWNGSSIEMLGLTWTLVQADKSAPKSKL